MEFPNHIRWDLFLFALHFNNVLRGNGADVLCCDFGDARTRIHLLAIPVYVFVLNMKGSFTILDGKPVVMYVTNSPRIHFVIC